MELVLAMGEARGKSQLGQEIGADIGVLTVKGGLIAPDLHITVS